MAKYFLNALLLGMIGIGFLPHAVSAATIDSKSLGYSQGANDHPHNLSSLSTGGVHAPAGGETQICKFCHTPHGASPDGPLWNRQDPAGPNGDGTFPLYGGSSLVISTDADAISASEYGAGTYPNGASRLCMSCHDGVTAVGEVISESAPLANLTLPANAFIDLSTSHPVSFVYDTTVLARINYFKNDGGAATYQLPASGGILDSNDRMQCTACHDPHVDTKEGPYTLPMWRNYSGVENSDYDGTCSICHIGGPSSVGIDWGTPGIPANHDLTPP